MLNKSLFTLVFNNCYLNRLIFDSVSSISSLNNRLHYRWSEVINKPLVLASHGYFDLLNQCLSSLDWILSHYEVFQLMRAAIISKSIDTVGCLIDRFYDGSDDLFLNKSLQLSSFYGCSVVTLYLLDRFKIQWNFNSVMEHSICTDNFEQLKFFVALANSSGYTSSDDNIQAHRGIFNLAAKTGRIDMIEYLLIHRPQDLKSSDMYTHAKERGHQHVIDYLISKGITNINKNSDSSNNNNNNNQS
ncbi:hypothetical protein PPL_11721 [Heterostelium album PN500]|uniref:Ankyrin repeat protein n=1 Tax=Heterostelium pallidum (strain ATCC 26659 / Pp 5 / PN500) TaxID=670386 RepID=D3BUA2_HETP5|nr:hypothetical protein PPL_11721 [Heterostelium album PN500]EFA75036.1 hypothetical protein PPL_11721 [Heterostelium album PN500]|eukprot:XP_020427170.1 hypothetical protein PPL_11721 [Heterostelium album PN500]